MEYPWFASSGFIYLAGAEVANNQILSINTATCFVFTDITHNDIDIITVYTVLSPWLPWGNTTRMGHTLPARDGASLIYR